MEYLEGLNKLREIEEKYDVMSIKMKGISIWPYLRIYVFDAMATHKAQEASVSAAKFLLKDLFFYNPLRLFKKYDIWNTSTRITRKKVGPYFEHHVSGALHKLGKKVLTIESTEPGITTMKRSEIPEKHIVSNAWFTLLYGGVFFLLKMLPVRIEGEQIIKDIIADAKIDFDYKSRDKILLAQKWATDILLGITFKPKLLIIECTYTRMGMVWSAHNHDIPVVEFQHGVINANHYAYSPKYHSREFYPDEICVYGVEEMKYFQTLGKEFSPKVSMMGLYILELSNQVFAKDIFNDYRDKYKSIIVVAGQTGFEKQLSAFVDKVAERLKDCFFIYIPRREDSSIHFEQPNVKYVFGVNIYEYLKWCDIHATISSTTCLEAHYFGKPVIFCDFLGVAKRYYGDILEEKNGARYIEDEEGFVSAQKELSEKLFEKKDIFAHQHQERLIEIIERYI